MLAVLSLRRWLTWTVAVLMAFAVVAAGLLATADVGLGRLLLIRYFSARIHRPIRVAGALHARLLSLHPRLVAEHVSIANPPWMPPGVVADVGQLTAVLKLPGIGHPGGIVAMALKDATLYLVRDARGHANWQLLDPDHPQNDSDLPILRSLSMPHAHVVLGDAQRHLQFDGTLSAEDPDGPAPGQSLRLEGAGQLNGRPVAFSVTADPLAAASHRTPYHFTFTESSSGSTAQGRGVLPRPFAFDDVDATFTATGPDLRDLYYLTGVRLLDTGAYRLTGALSRRGTHTGFTDLTIRSGQSDVHGTVAIDTTNGRPHFTIDLEAGSLRLMDLGSRAADRNPLPVSPLLLSDARFNPLVLRIGEADLRLRADQLLIGRLPVHDAVVSAVIDRGVLRAAPICADLFGGRIGARLVLDARSDNPTANVDLQVSGLQIGQIPLRKPGPPPLAGSLQAQVRIVGSGSSVHQVAASADGTVSVQIPQGAIRKSLAELTGVDLRGVGLLLTGNKTDTPIPVRGGGAPGPRRHAHRGGPGGRHRPGADHGRGSDPARVRDAGPDPARSSEEPAAVAPARADTGARHAGPPLLRHRPRPVPGRRRGSRYGPGRRLRGAAQAAGMIRDSSESRGTRTRAAIDSSTGTARIAQTANRVKCAPSNRPAV